MMAALDDDTVLALHANIVEPRMSDHPPTTWYDQESDTDEALHFDADDDWHDDDFDDDIDDDEDDDEEDDDDDFFPDDDEDLDDDVDDEDDDY